jgi:hypothetical protein
VVAMLNPDAQSMSTLLAQFRAASPRRCRSVRAFCRLAQIVSLIAGTIMLYVIGYVAFQRQR